MGPKYKKRSLIQNFLVQLFLSLYLLIFITQDVKKRTIKNYKPKMMKIGSKMFTATLCVYETRQRYDKITINGFSYN